MDPENTSDALSTRAKQLERARKRRAAKLKEKALKKQETKKRFRKLHSSTPTPSDRTSANTNNKRRRSARKRKLNEISVSDDHTQSEDDILPPNLKRHKAGKENQPPPKTKQQLIAKVASQQKQIKALKRTASPQHSRAARSTQVVSSKNETIKSQSRNIKHLKKEMDSPLDIYTAADTLCTHLQNDVVIPQHSIGSLRRLQDVLRLQINKYDKQIMQRANKKESTISKYKLDTVKRIESVISGLAEKFELSDSPYFLQI